MKRFFLFFLLLASLTNLNCFNNDKGDYKDKLIAEREELEQMMKAREEWEAAQKDKINESNLQTSFKYNSQEAKEISEDHVIKILKVIQKKDFIELLNFIHPKKGVRISNYNVIEVDSDLVFSKEELLEKYNSDEIFTWGVYFGSGAPYKKTVKEYFNGRIWHDYTKAEKIGYNEFFTFSGYEENHFEVYPDAIIIECYYPGVTHELDWRGKRMILEEYQGELYIVGFSESFWTP